METIIATGISAFATLLVCMINNHFQQKKSQSQQEETKALVIYRLDQLEKKVDLHNNAVERLYKVEQRLGIDEEKIKLANHRIEDLEKTS